MAIAIAISLALENYLSHEKKKAPRNWFRVNCRRLLEIASTQQLNFAPIGRPKAKHLSNTCLLRTIYPPMLELTVHVWPCDIRWLIIPKPVA